MKILVTGATGNTGSEVTRQLLAAGHAVRVLAHSADSAAKLPDGVEIQMGDFDDASALAAAFNGVEAAYALTPVNPKSAEWMQRLVDVAQSCGVRRFVKLSGMTAGANSPAALIRSHGQTDAYLRQSGIGYTIIQPNSFMQNLLWSVETIRSQGAFYQPTGDAKQSLVDIADVAAVVVKALTEDGHLGQTYVLTGPESLSFDMVADKIASAIGKPVHYVAVPVVAAEQSMLTAGMPAWMAHTLVEFYSAVATGAFAATTPDVQSLLGRPATSFDAFMARHAALFGEQGNGT